MTKYNMYIEDINVGELIDAHGGIEGARAFIRRKKKLVPVSFERNKHVHIVLTIFGLGLLGKQEIARLESAEFRMSELAESCLVTYNYDKNHLLVGDWQYKVALMPTSVISNDANRTTNALRKYGVEKYGYEKPLAGIVPRIMESVSAKQLEEFGYIVTPHEPIIGSNNRTNVLVVNPNGRFWIDAEPNGSGICWNDCGAVAFIESQN